MKELTRFVGLMFFIATFIGALIFVFLRDMFEFYLGAIATIFLFGMIFLIIAAHNHSLMGHMTDAFKSQMAVHSSMHRAVGQIVSGQSRAQTELIRLVSNTTHRQFEASVSTNPFALASMPPPVVEDDSILDDPSQYMEIEQWTNA